MVKPTLEYMENCSFMAYSRCMKGMSQSELARIVGCSRNTISSIENGSDCSLSLAFKIADALENDVHAVFEHPSYWKQIEYFNTTGD